MFIYAEQMGHFNRRQAACNFEKEGFYDTGKEGEAMIFLVKFFPKEET